MPQYWGAMADELKQIGNNIRKIRTKRGMTQVELAYASEIEENTLNRIEGGKTNPTVKTLLNIAKALDVKLAELVKIK
jgi:transcriptional regulator with XRE-family HTH domain